MLEINLDNFSLLNRNEFINESGEMKFWSQKDFSYKHRIHVYDCSDNEIGYVQFKILSTQSGNELYTKEDKRIDISEYSISDYVDEFTYSIALNNNVVAKIERKNNKAYLEIINNECLNECLLIIIENSGKGEF